MGSAERRMELLRILCLRRHETIKNLASEFGVSEKTIRRDVEELSLSEPIYTQAGRYDGGVYVMKGYSMDKCSANRMYMKKEELMLLRKLSEKAKADASLLAAEERELLDAIIIKYDKPKTV